MAYNFTISDSDVNFLKLKSTLDDMHRKCRSAKISSSVTVKVTEDFVHKYKSTTYKYNFSKLP